MKKKIVIKEIDKNEKSCKNCKYFLLNYAISNNCFIETCSGYCKNKNSKKYSIGDNKLCDFWKIG